MGLWNVPSDGKYGYLKGTCLASDGKETDISTEEAFASFIKNKEANSFDSESPYSVGRQSCQSRGTRKLSAMQL